jgi:hypothetical protein
VVNRLRLRRSRAKCSRKAGRNHDPCLLHGTDRWRRKRHMSLLTADAS